MTRVHRSSSHGVGLRGLDAVASSVSTEGRFGRMFRNVPVFEHRVEDLSALAATMIAPVDPRDSEPVSADDPPDDRENPLIPAGYTYLAQFVDHDITFDPVSSLQRQNDPDGLHDFRTPRLDLDSLYGRGPADQPYLYRNGLQPAPHPEFGFDQRGVTFLPGVHPSDLPRNSEGRALIGDPRNDENVIVSQLHVAFSSFHDRMVEHLFQERGLDGEELFAEAQRLVRWHYQWVVIHDLLPRIVDGDPGDGSTSESGVIHDVLRSEALATSGGREARIRRPELRFFHWQVQPFLPVEFAVAAYRYGHSAVRPSYVINDAVHRQRGGRRVPILASSRDPLASLRGFGPLPDGWGVEWKHFFDVDGSHRPQRGFRIDTALPPPLGELSWLPDMPNLARRNLIRGLRMGLPSGQGVARAMGIRPLSDADLSPRAGSADDAPSAPGFQGNAPLWFYVLREAELLADGQHLGPVGGRIVAEVLVGLVTGDPTSWLSVEPDWRPPLSHDGRFGMPELLRFASGARASAGTKPQGALDRWRHKFGD
ncbi:MAG TPA: heme peroxidase family protein [Jatrophihabitans sp.]|jgi:hypothetical protein|uniref:peroxidase family protein n=1 Tax=Jatrophihabitans sp. TaxID=1932789 RepID=UPI002EE98AEC